MTESQQDAGRQTTRRSGFVFVRILVVFGLLLGSYYAFAATELYQTWIFHPYVVVNTDLSGRILSLLGFEMVVTEVSLSSPEFALTIGPGCDGLEPTALFVAAVLAFAAPLALKLPALAIGVPLLASLYLVRIVSLFLVGIYYPRWFHTMHVEVWQVIYITFAMVFFAVWLLWATRPQAPSPAASN